MQPGDSAAAVDSSRSVVAGDLVVPDPDDTNVEALLAQVETMPSGTAEASEAHDQVAAIEPTIGGPTEADGEYFIHVSSFRTAGHADAVARQFTDGGLIATVHQQMVRESLWFRVYLGPFNTHDDAVRLANRLREEGTITYYKVTRLEAENGL
jgi:cell division protein FtsN